MLTRVQVEDAKAFCLNIPAQCLKNDEKYHSRGSRQVVVVSAFNNQTEANIVLYKDPYNENSNIFMEQLGPSGK